MRKLVPAVLLACICLMGCESGTRITSVEPAFGNVAGNDDVVIHGGGFKPGLVVQFGKSQVKGIVIDADNRIRVKTPAGVEGKVDVIVVRDDGKTLVLSNGFTYMRDAPSGK